MLAITKLTAKTAYVDYQGQERLGISIYGFSKPRGCLRYYLAPYHDQEDGMRVGRLWECKTHVY